VHTLRFLQPKGRATEPVVKDVNPAILEKSKRAGQQDNRDERDYFPICSHHNVVPLPKTLEKHFLRAAQTITTDARPNEAI
jgi:hypothetical protein